MSVRKTQQCSKEVKWESSVLGLCENPHSLLEKIVQQEVSALLAHTVVEWSEEQRPGSSETNYYVGRIH